MINVNVYPFLAFPYLTYHLEDTGIGFFSGFTELPDRSETEL